MKLKENFRDWKYWLKISTGVIPLLSLLIFFIANMVDFTNMNNLPLNLASGQEKSLSPSAVEVAMNWSKGERIGSAIVRNSSFATTIINYLALCFWLNSARNNKNEGEGKFDNPFVGIIIMSAAIWVVVSYNLTLTFSYGLASMKWYTYISWIGQHSIGPAIGIVYFFAFYNWKSVDFGSRKKQWLHSSYGMMVVNGYMILFIFIGLILKASNAPGLFGELSYTGHYPYSFLDLSRPSTVSDSIPMYVQLITVMIYSSLVTMGSYFAYVAIVKKKMNKQ